MIREQFPLPLEGGWHVGPLFVVRKRRLAARIDCRLSGGAEIWKKWMRTKPSPDDMDAWRAAVAEGRRLTRETGIQHSVDHIVPLNHPLVCGLHRAANFAVMPLSENIRKSNGWWPDMPEEQTSLFGN